MFNYQTLIGVVLFIAFSGIVFLILMAILVWKGLAPRDMFFTIVDEGTAVIIVKAGKFSHCLIQWEGRTFDADWNVVAGREPWHPFGGLRFYGVYPLYKRFAYKFRWTSMREDGKPSDRHDETLYSVLLKDFPYVLNLTGVEDSEMVPLDFTLIITARVTNPKKAIFDVQNWLEMLVAVLYPAFRVLVSGMTFQQVKGVSRDQLTVALDLVLADFAGRYGVYVSGVAIKDVVPTEEYKKMATMQYQAERQREATIVNAQAEALRLEQVGRALRANPEAATALALEALKASPAAALMPGVANLLRKLMED